MHAPTRRLLLASAIGSLLAPGCGADQTGDPGRGDRRDGAPPRERACTQASCVGSALVRLREIPAGAASVRVCADGRCEPRDGASRTVRIPMPPQDRSGGRSERTAAVLVEVRDGAGELLVRRSSSIRLTALRPNGRRCAPICWAGEVSVELGQG